MLVFRDGTATTPDVMDGFADAYVFPVIPNIAEVYGTLKSSTHC